MLADKGELLATSSQDQFAKWAKLRRKVDKGLADLEKLSELLKSCRLYRWNSQGMSRIRYRNRGSAHILFMGVQRIHLPCYNRSAIRHWLDLRQTSRFLPPSWMDGSRHLVVITAICPSRFDTSQLVVPYTFADLFITRRLCQLWYLANGMPKIHSHTREICSRVPNISCVPYPTVPRLVC